VPIHQRIASFLALAGGIVLGPGAEGRPPPERHVAYTQNADWVLIDRRDAFTARIAFSGDDDTSAVLIITCSSERGTISYSRQEFIDQPPMPVTMEITSGAMTILSEQATADVAGYATDRVRKRAFVSAMQKLTGQTEWRMDILGNSGQITLSFALLNDLGFVQAAARCSRIME
jgi:hypothetical protein